MNSGGGLDVFSGGTASSTTINSWSIHVYGFARGSIVMAGSIEFVSGGTAIGTVVESGGQETVQYGGTALGTVVDGNQFVEIGGTASGTDDSVGRCRNHQGRRHRPEGADLRW